MAEERISGGAQSLSIGGYSLPLNKTTPKVSPKYGDATDTSNWDDTNKVLHTSQILCAVTTELAVEGKFRKSATPTNIISKLYSGTGGPYAVVYKIDGTTQLFTGVYDITDFQIAAQADDICTFTCTLKSNGPVTPVG